MLFFNNWIRIVYLLELTTFSLVYGVIFTGFRADLPSNSLLKYYFAQAINTIILVLIFLTLFEKTRHILFLWLSVKLGLPPLHFWLVDALSVAPYNFMWLILTLQKLPLYILFYFMVFQPTFFSVIYLFFRIVFIILSIVKLSSAVIFIIITSLNHSVWLVLILYQSDILFFVYLCIYYVGFSVFLWCVHVNFFQFKNTNLLSAVGIVFIIGFPPSVVLFLKIYYVFSLRLITLFFSRLLLILIFSFYFFYLKFIYLFYIK